MRLLRHLTLGPASWVASYGLATASVGLALLATLWLRGSGIRGALFIPAVLLSAWYGGTGPALLAVSLSALSINSHLVGAGYSSRLSSLDDLLYVSVFSAAALLVASLTARQRRTERALRQARDELTTRLQDLEGINRQLHAEISERARAEAEMRKHASLLDLTHDTVFARNQSDVITYWNNGAAQLYGWSKEEAVGKISHQLLQTIFPAPLERIEATVNSTGRWEGELVHHRADGTSVMVESRWALQRDGQGQPVGVLEANNDITLRKRAEEAIRRQASLLDQSHDAIFVWEFAGVIVDWNRGAAHLYGYSRDEAIGRISHELLRTQHPMTAALFEAALERDKTWSGELTHTTRDGRQVIVDSRHVLLRQADGSQLVLETNRDITERKQASEALQDAQLQLAHVTRVTMLGEITASIAHEVKQPLAAIVMSGNACVRWLASDPPNLIEAREAAQRLVADAHRAGQVIDRVRALVKREPSVRSALDVNDVIAETLAFTRTEVARQGVALRMDLRTNLPTVVADRVQLQQVLVNLILNGVDAMSAVNGPRVLTITSRTEDVGRISIGVKDCGMGLAPGESDRIFDPFFTTKPGGLGIGLSVSRSIVELHGGKLSAMPNDGPGITMQLSLPAPPGYPASGAPGA